MAWERELQDLLREIGRQVVETTYNQVEPMRWSAEGAQMILNLRSIRLSGIWPPTYRACLQARVNYLPRTPAQLVPTPPSKTA